MSKKRILSLVLAVILILVITGYSNKQEKEIGSIYIIRIDQRTCYCLKKNQIQGVHRKCKNENSKYTINSEKPLTSCV